MILVIGEDNKQDVLAQKSLWEELGDIKLSHLQPFYIIARNFTIKWVSLSPIPSPQPILSSHFYAIYKIPITFWLSHILWEQWNCRLDLVCKKLANLPHIRILLNFPHIESTKTIKGKRNNLDIYRLLYRLKVIVQKFLEVKTDNFPPLLSLLYLNWVDVDSVSITRKG